MAGRGKRKAQLAKVAHPTIETRTQRFQALLLSTFRKSIVPLESSADVLLASLLTSGVLVPAILLIVWICWT